MTQKDIDEAIANCRWLSQNRGFGNAIPDICSGACLPCKRVIERGRCDTLMELFRNNPEESVPFPQPYDDELESELRGR